MELWKKEKSGKAVMKYLSFLSPRYCQDFPALHGTQLPARFQIIPSIHILREVHTTIFYYISPNMGIAFDYAPDRPQNISEILGGLERYNPETTAIFQEYVSQQCEDRTYDCYANLALLKLCVSFLSLTQIYTQTERGLR